MEGFLLSGVAFVAFVPFLEAVTVAFDAVGKGNRESVNFSKTSENRGASY